MRFQYKSESSSKFWEPQLNETTFTVCFGKIGTKGQKRTRTYSSPAKAKAEYRKLVCEKLAKGYKPTTETVHALLEGAVPVEKPKAIASLCIGEHVPDKVTIDICGWATACIQNGMTPKQFQSVWEKVNPDTGDPDLGEALGMTEGYSWLVGDDMDWGEDELFELYAQAVENDGDRFIWYNDNAFIYVIALRGNPGARAIEICLREGEENC